MLTFIKSGDFRGHLKEVSGVPGGNQVSKLVLRGANEFAGPRGFQIGVTLDALLTFLKSGAFRGHLKEVSGVPGGNQVSKVVLRGVNELP